MNTEAGAPVAMPKVAREERGQLARPGIERSANCSARPTQRKGDLDLDQDFVIFNLYGINGNLRSRRSGLPRLRIPCPAVPRADDLAVFDHALAERSSHVETDIIHRVNLSVDVGDADRLVAAGKFFGFVRGGKVGLGREFGKHSS